MDAEEADVEVDVEAAVACPLPQRTVNGEGHRAGAAWQPPWWELMRRCQPLALVGILLAAIRTTPR